MRVPSAWPEWLDSVWAKSPRAGATEGETLAAHTWAVLCRLRDLVRLRPGLPDAVGLPRLWHLLFWAALLHDWGKAAKGFQAAVRGGAAWWHRHEVLSLAFLNWIGDVLADDEAAWVAAGICLHHKDMPELQVLYPLGLEPEDDPVSALVQELSEEAVRGLWRWLSQVAEHWVCELGLEGAGIRLPILAGGGEAPVSTQDEAAKWIRTWMRRCRALLRELEQDSGDRLRVWLMLLRGYILQSDHAASAGVRVLPAADVRREVVLTAAHVTPDALHPHQREAANVSGSAILIAPTGSGKTESALLWVAHQVEMRGAIPRVFYTLPYQASMNAMYDRLCAMFPERVGLIHGRSTLALYRRLMDQNYSPTEATSLARHLHDLARLNVLPIRVFSPYQMLKAVYQLKGYEAMLADYAQALFIFDEIHAYEPARLAMILETVRYLRERLGACFFVMTATMPAPVRRYVHEALGGPPLVRASDDVFRAFGRHQLHLLSGELISDDGLGRIADAFTRGQSVLVTCNTVARAQQAYQALKDRLPPDLSCRVILLHGRFNGRDRLTKERAIIGAVGMGSAERRPVLVVSTQVVEVSLNIDLDTIYTDPAPLEALIQRFGRVNRRRRQHLAPVYVFTEPADGQGVYAPPLVQRALETLTAHANGRAIDEAAIQGWLDEIYQGDALREWEKTYSEVAREFADAFLRPLRPFNSDAGLEQEFNRLFDGVEVLPSVLVHEYNRLREERPLEAAECLVPIGWRQWAFLKQARRVVSAPDVWPPVVDTPYSPETGLEFER